MKRTMQGIAALLMGLGLLAGASAADSEEEVPKDVKDAIFKIADLLEKGKADDAKKEAAAIAKKKGFDGGKPNSTTDLMHGFAPRTKKGFGVGDKPGMIKPDGIESKIQVLGDDKKKLTPKALTAEAADIKKMAYTAAAIGMITVEATPAKDAPKKKASDWKKWAEEMRDYGLELGKASGGSDTKAVQLASRKLDGSCTSCHEVFRK